VLSCGPVRQNNNTRAQFRCCNKRRFTTDSTDSWLGCGGNYLVVAIVQYCYSILVISMLLNKSITISIAISVLITVISAK
jgi:hypothetical protein